MTERQKMIENRVDSLEGSGRLQPMEEITREIVSERCSSNIGVVYHIATRFKKRYPTLDYDELVSVGYLQLFKSAKTFREGGQTFTNYTYKMIQFRMKDHLRKIFGRSKCRYKDQQQRRTSFYWICNYDPRQDLECKQNDHDSRIEEIPELLDQLPTKQRDVIARHFVKGESRADIAAEMGMNVGTISWHINQGIIALRKLWTLDK